MPYEHDAPLPPPAPPTPRRLGPFAPLAWSWQGAVVSVVLYVAVALATDLGPGISLGVIAGCLVAGRLVGWALWTRRRS